MRMTPQDYFAKLVDVQFDLDALHDIWHQVPIELRQAKEDGDYRRRVWSKIATGKDSPTPENYAKLTAFHEQLNAAIVVLKDSGFQFLPDAPATRDFADVAYDLLKVGQTHYLRHYIANSKPSYDLQLFRNEKFDTLEKKRAVSAVFNESCERHLTENLERQREILTPLNDELRAIVAETPHDPDRLRDFHLKVLETIDTLKAARIQAEYTLEADYISVACPVPRP